MLKRLTTDEIKTLFTTKYKGQANIMTPEIIKYGQARHMVYELSKGTGMNREPIYGVTVLLKDGDRPINNLNKGGISKLEALTYIKQLRSKLR